MALTTPGSAVLPEDATNTYHKFLEAVQRHGPPHGSTAEDLTNGHSLMADPDARELQYRFADFAGAHLPLLREVLLTGLTISTINRPISFSRITNSRTIIRPPFLLLVDARDFPFTELKCSSTRTRSSTFHGKVIAVVARDFMRANSGVKR